MIEQYFDGTDDPVAARAEMEGAYPGKRIAHPREVAMAAVFLVSDESSFVNGTPILVDGGLPPRRISYSATQTRHDALSAIFFAARR